MVAVALIELPELKEEEKFPDNFETVIPFLESGDPTEFVETRGTIKWSLICISEHWLGNARIIPYLFGMALIPVTYLFVTELTRHKLAGFIAVLVLISSGTYYMFNTTATYEQSWVVFLLLSMWLALRGNWIASMIVYAVAIGAKPLALIYFPMFLFMIYKTPLHRRKKLYMYYWISFTVLFFALLAIAYGTPQMIGGSFTWNPDLFVAGFFNWFFYLDSALIVALFTPLILIKLAFTNKQSGKNQALIIISFIIGIIISVPLIEGLTTQLNHAYRFVPLVIFAGAGLGLIVSNIFAPKKIFPA